MKLVIAFARKCRELAFWRYWISEKFVSSSVIAQVSIGFVSIAVCCNEIRLYDINHYSQRRKRHTCKNFINSIYFEIIISRVQRVKIRRCSHTKCLVRIHGNICMQIICEFAMNLQIIRQEDALFVNTADLLRGHIKILCRWICCEVARKTYRKVAFSETASNLKVQRNWMTCMIYCKCSAFIL